MTPRPARAGVARRAAERMPAHVPDRPTTDHTAPVGPGRTAARSAR
ncbi:hypothetical protein ABIA38_001919 [Embleya sp. AB8]